MPTAYIGIGSNLGDRRENIAAALRLLAADGRIELAAVSTLIETDPVGGPPGQGKFLNGAAMLRTRLSPAELHRRLHEVEDRLGRERTVHWGPRTIDLDLLLYDRQVIEEPELTVPHPLLARRRFVLEPLAEIAPDVVVPGTEKTVRELLNGLAD